MDQITFSVITTIFNEATTINQLLDSLRVQTLLPGEIIIVDAGSTDGSQRLIEQWHKDNPGIPVRILEKPGVNRSRGRNLAIATTQGDYVAVIDGGCQADQDWLERFAHVFRTDGRIDVVAGFYRTKPVNKWQQGFAPYLAVMPDRVDTQTYLPSSRSLAFTKRVWKRVGGYPENLQTCEDLVFAQRLRAQSQMVVEPKALVTWRLPNTLEDYFMRVVGYARGDVEAGYMPHIWHITSVALRYILFYLLPILLLVYLVYPIVMHFKYLKNKRYFWVLPVIQLITDAGVIMGASWGFGIRFVPTKIRVFGKSARHWRHNRIDEDRDR